MMFSVFSGLSVSKALRMRRHARTSASLRSV